MQSGLFSELEHRIDGLIETVELLRLELSELRQEKAALETERAETEQNLQRLLGKFERLQESENL
ncbi:MAG: cell division protein ZapB [Pseudomonadota bacterium]|jgi:FtsZ-binding cell division protein ZapB|nr:cell division protein ZapB [Pseudomonadota bacterium]